MPAVPDPHWPTAAEWLAQASDAPEMVVLGVPLSVTALTQPSGAHETPPAVRKRLGGLSTYHSERDVDLGGLAVRDLGDLAPQPSHDQIADRVAAAAAGVPLVALLGGDNALTYPAMLGLAGEDLAGWGLVTLDAHHDVRIYDGRPNNGAVVRALVDAGLPGRQVVQLGISGFCNSPAYRRWCEDAGVDVVTAAEVRFGSLEDVLVEAFERLSATVDHFYVDLDVDVLDSSFAPACPGARPGGLTPVELQAAAFLAGRQPGVRAVDIVEVDVTKDLGLRTADVAALCLLNVAAGLDDRLH